MIAAEKSFAVTGQRPGLPRAGVPALPAATVDPLARLIRISRSNDRLLGELAVAKRRLRQARDYQADPTSNIDLGNALVAHARSRQARVLGRLDENRAEALRLLAGGSDVR